MHQKELVRKVVALRQTGMTYAAIQEILEVKIPKSTFSYWCRDIALPVEFIEKSKQRNLENLKRAREVALKVQRKQREEYIQKILEKNYHLAEKVKNDDTAKIILAMLYLGEGSKSMKRGALVFGNSDPVVISLFLGLMRRCYKINESKFRCTVLCRADQNVKELNRFWSHITHIPPQQFYSARIDSRSIGKVTNKKEYKGVCRIDYFSAEILIDLLISIKVLTRACSSLG